MKIISGILFIAATAFCSVNQSMELINDIVYHNKKPVAKFIKIPYSLGRASSTGINVININKQVIMTAEPKMAVSTSEFGKSFIYYDIRFNGYAERIFAYPEKVLSLHIFDMINNNGLIKNNAIDSSGLANLIKTYDRKPLLDKMKKSKVPSVQ